MFKKIVIALDKEKSENLVEIKQVEKIKNNIKLKVDAKHKAVIYKDFAVSNVFQMGEYKPFLKQDKKHSIHVVFVNTEKSSLYPFATRQTQSKDKVSGEIYSLEFRGDYSFSVRNERKFMGTFNSEFKNLSKLDFVNKLEDQINSLILSYVLNYFDTNKVSFKDCQKNKEKLEKHILVNLGKYLDDTYGVEIREIKLNLINVTEAFN